MNENGDTYTQWQHEREMTRIEIQAKRWFILCMVLLASLLLSNIAWIIYENSFQDIVLTQDGYVDGNGSNYLNGTGEMIYGGSQSEADD